MGTGGDALARERFGDGVPHGLRVRAHDAEHRRPGSAQANPHEVRVLDLQHFREAGNQRRAEGLMPAVVEKGAMELGPSGE